MIQRIQTLFLSLVILFMAAFCVMNIWEKKSKTGNTTVSLNAFQMATTSDNIVINTQNTIWLAAIALVVIGLAAWSISQYKNRLRQMQIGFGISFMVSLLLGLIVYHERQAGSIIPDSAESTFGPGLIIPALALIANMLANKFIRQDEKMVRDADRMR
ncbi:MAG: DUF4293 domain-containing protein [Cytophagales bacterium]|nr:DUF4293 domain-containing protein [Cytophagales bacterium]